MRRLFYWVAGLVLGAVLASAAQAQPRRARLEWRTYKGLADIARDGIAPAEELLVVRLLAFSALLTPPETLEGPEQGAPADVAAPVPGGLNVGDGGVVDVAVRADAALTETLTLTAVDDTTFTVVGDVTGSHADAPVGEEYYTDGAEVALRIVAGAVPFAPGDTFTVAVTGATEPAQRIRAVQRNAARRLRRLLEQNGY